MDSMLRDRIVCGIKSKEVQKKRLDQGAILNLQQANTIARNHEIGYDEYMII